MGASLLGDEQRRILRYWWMLELFSPQSVPKLTPRATRPADRQVIAWKPGEQLPWEVLTAPKPLGRRRRVWQHTVYLGVYELEATYGRLHRAFGEDADAYDGRPPGRSACAGVMVDARGMLSVESAVLSSALWAVAQIDEQGVRGETWADGFPDASIAFQTAVDAHEGARREPDDAEEPPPQDARSLHALLRIAHASAGIAGTPRLATDDIVIQSVAVPAQQSEGTGDIDFLNSFFLDDLATVRDAETGSHGAALRAYLTRDGAVDERARIDVIATDRAADAGVTLERLPKGRWPSDPRHSLSLRQQFAVNEALADLAPDRGIRGVNGPPGTGKTTMLRDILAGNVVERARQLAALARPEDAFTPITHEWSDNEGFPRKVRQLRPELTGYEMVVASANNAAVENVTTEIPARDAIHSRWREGADYFSEIATAVLAETSAENVAESGAWGMVAARLGNKRNRRAFHSAFWFDKTDPVTKKRVSGSTPRMQTRLTQWGDGTVPHRSWADARAVFTRAERRVDDLLAQRRLAEERLRLLPGATDEHLRRAEQVARLAAAVRDAQEREREARAETIRTQQETGRAVAARDRHLAVRPGLLETIFSFGRAIRDWRVALAPYDDVLGAAEADQHHAETRARELDARAAALRHELVLAEGARDRAVEALADLRGRIADDGRRWGAAHPGESWRGEARELRAPWLDAELDEARSELFLAALKLHEDFFANASRDMVKGLRAALDVVAGSAPPQLEPEKRRAAWQLFFLMVPLVSTTFASFGRMFGGLGRESIGWLLIDEAGQAAPQQAVGAIWRAERVIAVGDPLQLQPVVTMPQKARRDIASAYGVSETWIAPRASVQALADRVSRYGTVLRQGEGEVWVSAPLTVHRRCDDPMFALCNDIAYNGIMVNGVVRRLDDPEHPDLFDSADGPLIVPSHWADEPAPTRGTHLQENQIARLERELDDLQEQGIALDDVIAISPFRAVADRLGALARTRPGLRAGTIHTAQGREASVVFLVLGGDPSAPGAKAWAASTVNLVNVAASRAKRRLYVIGDRASWAEHNYFRQLAAALRSPRPLERSS